MNTLHPKLQILLTILNKTNPPPIHIDGDTIKWQHTSYDDTLSTALEQMIQKWGCKYEIKDEYIKSTTFPNWKGERWCIISGQ
tara:strand:+ start:5338 stop:5586 length:249 start_codon:yes stop_codon:yes gene_type:complete